MIFVSASIAGRTMTDIFEKYKSHVDWLTESMGPPGFETWQRDPYGVWFKNKHDAIIFKLRFVL